MSLITCPECGHSVSSMAISCPGCGFPINYATSAETAVAVHTKRPRKKHKKLPNGFGSIKKLSGNRNKPYAAYPPIAEFKDNGSPVAVPAVGYYEDWYTAFDALREYNRAPYDLRNRDTTFKEVFQNYFKEKYELNQKRSFSMSSKNSANAAFKNCKALHDRKFKELRKADLQNVIDSCPLKHASLELIVTLFKGMYKYALENEIADKDYSQFVTINIRDDDEKGEPFTQEEISLLWKNQDRDSVRMILIMIYSGFRIKAFETMEINTEEWYFRGGVKTAAGKGRIVPVHDSIREYIKQFSESRFSAETFRTRRFYPVLEELGIAYTADGKKHTPHDCRHTFSWLCDHYHVDELSKHILMGHSLGNDVERSVYGHRTLEELRTEINKIRV